MLARTTTAIALLLSLARPHSALAQGARDSASAADGAERGARLFTRKDLVLAAGFAGATVALFPLDRHIATELQDSSTQANRFFHHGATGLELITDPGSLVIGGSLYLVGRITHVRRMADLGLHGTEAVVLSGTITGVLKGVLGRSRPFVTADTNPMDFQLFAGLRHTAGRTSFPSGHTTAAFAAASAVTAETGRWWPRSTWVIGPVMYGGATLVGLSRMYHNKHWASDVALGAAIGTFSGMKVVQYSHAHPDNRVDRLLLGAERLSVRPGEYGGVIVGWNVRLGGGGE